MRQYDLRDHDDQCGKFGRAETKPARVPRPSSSYLGRPFLDVLAGQAAVVRATGFGSVEDFGEDLEALATLGRRGIAQNRLGATVRICVRGVDVVIPASSAARTQAVA